MPKSSYVLFAQNKGQWNDKVLFEGKFKGGKVFLERQGFSYIFYPKDGLESLHHKHDEVGSFTYHSVKMDFENCNSNPQIQQSDSNSFFENYFIGNDPSKWASRVKSYKQIKYHDLYKGIDLKLFSDKNNFRFDFVIKPGADVNQLVMNFTGQDRLSVVDGDLIIHTEVGEIAQQAPYAYQIINGKEIKVECSYSLEKDRVRFKLGNNYNKDHELIIDPTLVFATYTGSLSDNFGMTATYDVQGNAYTAGMCFGPSYPLSPGAFQTVYMGGTGYGGDISVSKFGPTGANLLYSTYIGGTGNESPQSIVVDNLGQLVVFGRSYSANYPVTSGVFQTANAGGCDLIITKLNATGTGLVASTFLGGSQNDGVNSTTTLGGIHYNYSDDLRGSVIVDNTNNIYIAASTISSNFPVTPGCIQNSLNGPQDGCVAKLNPNLTALIYSTYYGGSSMDGVYSITLNSNDELYVTGGTSSTNFYTTPGSLHAASQGGIDGFVSLLAFNGNSVLASTYIGTPSYDQSYFVEVDKQGRVNLFGQTEGSYPVSAGVYSNPNSGQFIQCLSPNLTNSIFSTVVGSGDGFPDISPSAFLVDVCGNIYLSGWGGTMFGNNQFNSSTSGLPVTANAFINTTDGEDFYFMVLNPNATALQYATFFGGSLSREHVDGGTSRFDKSGVIYQAICESCGGNNDMPTTPTAWSTTNGSPNCNNAVVKFAFSPNLVVAQSGISASNTTGCVPLAINFSNNSVNGVNYFWDFGDGTQSTTFAPAHTYTAVGVYTVQLIANNNATCNKWDTVYTTITVLSLNNMSVTIPSQSGCAPLLVNFSNSNSTTANYFWKFGDGTTATTYSASHTYTAIGNYTVQLISQNILTCNIYDTAYATINVVSVLALTPLPAMQSGCAPLQVSFPNTNDTTAVTYSWDFGDGNTSTTFAPVHTYSTAGVYTVQLVSFSSNSCNISDTVYTTVTVAPPLNLVSVPSQSMCLGDSIQLNLGAPAGCSYTWTPNVFLNNAGIQQPTVSPPADQLYHVTVEKNGCYKYDSAQVFVFKNDTKIILDPAHACIDDTVRLLADQVCSSYFWSNGQNTAVVNVFTPGWYYLTTISNNCLFKDSIRVDSFTHVPMNTYSVAICVNDKKQLIGPFGNYDYEWTPAYEIDHTDIFNPFVSPKYNTTYTLNVYNGPCITTGTYAVIVYALPTLTVTPKTAEVFSGEVVQMYCTSDTISTWMPDYMLSCIFCNGAAATVPSSITYYAIVANEFGCVAKDSVEIKVTPTLYIPNSFSPNGDGINDIFKPEYSGYVEIELLIFDRWGEHIFKTNDLDGGWNGTYKNVNCELGVYTYKLTAKDIASNTLEKVGHVTLLR
ncbi:MAG: PKD domain-containing protein [Bacteroidota bacterium]